MNSTTSPGTPRPQERGTALLMMLLMLLAIAAMAVTHLTKVLSEQQKVKVRTYASRAIVLAEGELERAKNIVNAAPYTAGANTALIAALSRTPPYVPGTEVEVQRVTGSAEWFLLRASSRYAGIDRTAQEFVRQRAPVSAYNLFVLDHPVGVSGAPRGAIHCNRYIDFYFPNGRYIDEVNAAEGFNFVAGAAPENTQLLGPHDASAPPVNVLEGIEISDLADRADTLRVTDDLIAEIEFQGSDTEVKLFTPRTTIAVERTGVRSVFDHFEYDTVIDRIPVYVDQAYTETVPVYETQSYTVTENVPVYRYEPRTRLRVRPVIETRTIEYTVQVPVYDTRMVARTRNERVWVEDPPPGHADREESGGTVGGGHGRGRGHWEVIVVTDMVPETYIREYREETRTRTESVQIGVETYTEHYNERILERNDTRVVTRTRQVQIGTRDEVRTRRVYSHDEERSRSVERPVYRDEPYTYFEDVEIPEAYLRTENVPTAGVIYIEGEVRKLGGRVAGQVSLVTNSRVSVTDSVVYVDNDDDTRMLHGSEPDEPYLPNPDYTGSSVFALMANGDILYAADGPQNLEINASLISVNGKVAFEGITPSDDGASVSATFDPHRDPSDYIKESLRRLGGVVSRFRPVATYIDEGNEVLAGYQRGTSIMDRNLLLKNGGNISPPFIFQEDVPVWTMSLGGVQMEPR